MHISGPCLSKANAIYMYTIEMLSVHAYVVDEDMLFRIERMYNVPVVVLNTLPESGQKCIVREIITLQDLLQRVTELGLSCFK